MRQSIHYPSLYIDGEFVPTPQLDEIINPATEEVVGAASRGTAELALAAVHAAREAFDNGPWPRLPAVQRQAKLQAFIGALRRRAAEIVNLIVTEAGATRPIAEFMQYGLAMQHSQHYVDLCTGPATKPLAIELSASPGGAKLLGGGVQVREPVGVVSAITPYNFPFFLNVSKIIPALAVGCSVVLKPSPYTPCQALLLGQVAHEVGLPKGVLNIITGGNEVGMHLTSDPAVDLITFTGSDAVGSKIQAQAAPTLKRLVLELGGKSALIVRHDADLAQAAAAGATFCIHSGQGCALLTRHLVHNSIRQQYVAALETIVRAHKIGNPGDPTVTLGPLIRESQRARAEQYVALGRDEGARLVCGGKRPEGLDKGYFFEPTIFDEVRNTMRVAREEIFGPIAVVIGFDSDEEAVALANDSPFGLSGGIFSTDVGRAYELAMQVRTGGISINGGTGGMPSHFPFGGIKRSGFGREYGEEGLNEFTYIKTIGFHGG